MRLPSVNAPTRAQRPDTPITQPKPKEEKPRTGLAKYLARLEHSILHLLFYATPGFFRPGNRSINSVVVSSVNCRSTSGNCSKDRKVIKELEVIVSNVVSDLLWGTYGSRARLLAHDAGQHRCSLQTNVLWGFLRCIGVKQVGDIERSYGAKRIGFKEKKDRF
jgi:hypothetical protein